MNSKFKLIYFYNYCVYIGALEKAIGLCVEGADVSTICGTIDSFVEE